MNTTAPFYDRVGMYAERIRAELSRGLPPPTVPELKTRLGCSEDIIRTALDRLEFVGEVKKEKRFVPGRRGTAPYVYFLSSPPNQ